MVEAVSGYSDLVPTNEGRSWYDYGAAAVSGASDLGGDIAGAGRYLADVTGGNNGSDFARNLAEYLSSKSDQVKDTMTPEGRRSLESSFGDTNFWTLLGDIPMKAAQMTPQLAAYVAGGLPTGLALSVATQVGDSENDIYKGIDNAKPEDLMQNQVYRDAIASGMSDKEARRQLAVAVSGMRPLLNAAAGALDALTGNVRMLRDIAGGKGGFAGGIIRRVGKGAAEEGVTEGIQNAVQDATVQSALINAGVQKGGYNYGQTLDQTLTGVIVGAGIGGPIGAFHTDHAGPGVPHGSAGTPGVSPPAGGPPAGGPPPTPRNMAPLYTPPAAGSTMPPMSGPAHTMPPMSAPVPNTSPAAATGTLNATTGGPGAPTANANTATPTAPPAAQPPNMGEINAELDRKLGANPNTSMTPDQVAAEQNAGGQPSAPATPTMPPAGSSGVALTAAQAGVKAAQAASKKKATPKDANARPRIEVLAELHALGLVPTSARGRTNAAGVGISTSDMEAQIAAHKAKGVRSPEAGEAKPAEATPEVKPPEEAHPSNYVKTTDAEGKTVWVNPNAEGVNLNENIRKGEEADAERARQEDEDLALALHEGPKHGAKVVEAFDPEFTNLKNNPRKKAQYEGYRQRQQIAERVVDAHPPVEGETAEQAFARAERMVQAAYDAGMKPPEHKPANKNSPKAEDLVKFPANGVKRGKRGNILHGPEVMTLLEAHDLVKKAAGSKKFTGAARAKRIAEFQAREKDIARNYEEAWQNRAVEAEDENNKQGGNAAIENSKAGEIDEKANTEAIEREGEDLADESHQSGDREAANERAAEKEDIEARGAAGNLADEAHTEIGEKSGDVQLDEHTSEQQRLAAENIARVANKTFSDMSGKVRQEAAKKEMAARGMTVQDLLKRAKQEGKKPADYTNELAKAWAEREAKAAEPTPKVDKSAINPDAEAMREAAMKHAERLLMAEDLKTANKVKKSFGEILRELEDMSDEHVENTAYHYLKAHDVADPYVHSREEGLRKLLAQHERFVAEHTPKVEALTDDERAIEAAGIVGKVMGDKISREEGVAKLKELFGDSEQGKQYRERLRERATGAEPATVQRPISIDEARPARVTDARTVLGELDPGFLKGVPKYFQSTLIKAMQKASGDTKVYFLSDKEFNRVLPGRDKAAGIFRHTEDYRNRYIVIRDSLQGHERYKTIMHEIAHDFTMYEIERNPKLHDAISKLMDHVYSRYAGDINAEFNSDYQYAMSSVEEFVAESFSNATVQNMLADVRVPSELAAEFKKVTGTKAGSAWDVLVDITHGILSKLGWKYPRGHSAVEQLMRIAEASHRSREAFNQTEAHHKANAAFRENLRNVGQITRDFIANPMKEAMDAAHAAANQPDAAAKFRKFLAAITPMHQYVEYNRKYFKGFLDNLWHTGEQKTAAMRRYAQEGQEYVYRLNAKKAQNRELFDQYASLVHDVSYHAVRPDRGVDTQFPIAKAHVGKPLNEIPIETRLGRQAHADLKTRYDAIVAQDPDYAGLLDDGYKLTNKYQRLRAKEHIATVLAGAGMKDKNGVAYNGARIQRLANMLASPRGGGKSLLDLIAKRTSQNAADSIKGLREMLVGNRPYVPFMREGDIVVAATRKVDAPANAKSVTEGRIVEFGTKEEASDFAAAHPDFAPNWRPKYVEKATGKTLTKTDMEDLEAQHPGSTETTHVVSLNNRHMEQFPSRKEAEARRKELVATGKFDKVYAEPKETFVGSATGFKQEDITRIVRNLHKEASYETANAAQRRDMENAVRNTILQTTFGHSAPTIAIPRRGTSGWGNDLVRNMNVYFDKMAAGRARAEYDPKMHRTLDTMKRYMESQRGGDPADVMRRREVFDEVRSRVYSDDGTSQYGWLDKAAPRFMTLNFMNRLGRPSYLLMHQTHLPVVFVPYAGARHGYVATAREMAANWKKVAGLYKTAITEAGNRFRDPASNGFDFGKFVKDTFKDDADAKSVNKLVDEMAAIGSINPHTGYEIGHWNASMEDTTLGKADRVAARFSKAFSGTTESLEAINRYVAAITAYRLEVKRAITKGATADEAHTLGVKYATKVINDTEGQYTHTNSAPLFRNRIARPFLQFRQYPVIIYHTLVSNTVRAFKGATKEERIEAAKIVGGIIGTHTLMAGALAGAPTEGVALAMYILKAFGLTETDWSDAEEAAQVAVAKQLGPDAAKLVMRQGVMGLLGIDVSGRINLNSLLTYNIPDGKMTPEKHYEFWSDMLLGAPLGLVKDAGKGINEVMSGDIAKGATDIIPLQTFRDAFKAIHGTAGANEHTSLQYTPYERVLKMAGFRTSREAEFFNRKDEFKNAREMNAQKKMDLIRKYLDSKNRGDEIKAYNAIRKFNEGLPYAAQITDRQLAAALRGQAPLSGEDRNHHLFMRLKRADQRFADQDNQTWGELQ